MYIKDKKHQKPRRKPNFSNNCLDPGTSEAENSRNNLPVTESSYVKTKLHLKSSERKMKMEILKLSLAPLGGLTIITK